MKLNTEQINKTIGEKYTEAKPICIMLGQFDFIGPGKISEYVITLVLVE